MKILICTIKSWNLVQAQKLKEYYGKTHEVFIISDPDMLLTETDKINPDYIFFPHWSYMIPSQVHEKYKCVVFHMTDLPFGRGGSPLQNLIARGIYQTKISAIRVVDQLDAGPVFMKEDLKLDGSAEEIFKRAAEIIFTKMIPFIVEEDPEPLEQEGQVVTFRRRKPEDGEITKGMPLYQIYDYIRMLDAEGYPPAYISFGKYQLEFSRASYQDGKLTAAVEFVEKKEEGH